MQNKLIWRISFCCQKSLTPQSMDFNVLCLYNQHKIIQIYGQDLLHAKWTTNEQCCFCINVGDILL